MITIALTNQQTTLRIDRRRLRRAVRMVLKGAGVREAEISLAVVDDPTIQRLNRQYLHHDDPTDVLSFLLERLEGKLSGEVIVSADTACSAAKRFGLSPDDELLLYVLHGTLHLVGYDDSRPAARARMRRQEALCLAHFGLKRGV